MFLAPTSGGVALGAAQETVGDTANDIALRQNPAAFFGSIVWIHQSNKNLYHISQQSTTTKSITTIVEEDEDHHEADSEETEEQKQMKQHEKMKNIIDSIDITSDIAIVYRSCVGFMLVQLIQKEDRVGLFSLWKNKECYSASIERIKNVLSTSGFEYSMNDMEEWNCLQTIVSRPHSWAPY